jgi:hypothetical protein
MLDTARRSRIQQLDN